MKMAYEVGALLAKSGAILVCGGLGGAMEAAAKGAKEHSAVTVGLLPGMTRNDANPYIDIAIPTGLGEIRNVLVVRSADAVIALPGEYGTLSEIAFAVLAGRPVISLGSWCPDARVISAPTPSEAVKLALEKATSG
jgi:uncharacterized protein (TIGR00725 family)